MVLHPFFPFISHFILGARGYGLSRMGLSEQPQAGTFFFEICLDLTYLCFIEKRCQLGIDDQFLFTVGNSSIRNDPALEGSH